MLTGWSKRGLSWSGCFACASACSLSSASCAVATTERTCATTQANHKVYEHTGQLPIFRGKGWYKTAAMWSCSCCHSYAWRPAKFLVADKLFQTRCCSVVQRSPAHLRVSDTLRGGVQHRQQARQEHLCVFRLVHHLMQK